MGQYSLESGKGVKRPSLEDQGGYDEKLLRESKDIHFNQAYIDNFFAEDNYKKNNIVIFNFEVDDLRSEYQRIKSLGIGEVIRV